jgi:hypothetical protein
MNIAIQSKQNLPLLGQPKPYGKVRPDCQQVDSEIDGIEKLREDLGTDDPFRSWQQQQPNNDVQVDPANLKTWFPCDGC